MVLNAATLRSLEIVSNNHNHSEHSTLFWAVNRTLTRFGERLLKLWLVKPLKDLGKIEERLNIVTEIIHSESVVFEMIVKTLTKLPDLEKILCSVFYHKCSCHEFVKLTQALIKIKSEFLALADKITLEIETKRIKEILCKISNLLENIERFICNINLEAAKGEDKINIFRDTTLYSSVETCKSKISSIEQELRDLRPHICKILRLPGFKYSVVSGQKYLIEVPNSLIPLVPKDWLKISATKQFSRFRSPEVISLHKKLELHQEQLAEYCNEAWHSFLNEFGKDFYKYKKAVSYLAELDCYLSFAKLAKEEKYCRPIVMDTNERTFDVQQGRHPVVVKLMGEENQFVSNDIKLNSKERCFIVTGPNMGGKSTFVRQVALIAVLSHVGCYVPAESATLPLLDGIYVRMGADDDIINNRSTFMVEMCETSEILADATSNSLVILDELGRGTSTNDGTAIAYATLEYLISDVQCLTLFVTHFPTVVELRNQYAENVIAVHMGYILKNISDADDIESVTFLYNVVPGVSEKSYGINVAALAGISRNILTVAARQSRKLELRMKIHRNIRKLKEFFKKEQELSYLQPSTSQT